MTTSTLKTARLCLRKPRPEDLSACAELLGDYEVSKMTSRIPHPYDLELGRQRLEKNILDWSDRANADDLSFHVDLENQMIGGVGFKKLQSAPEIGYWLGRPYWGKGYMSEAVASALQWLFENTDHMQIAGEAMIENPASLKVMQKLGFQETARVGCSSLSRGATFPAIRLELTRDQFMNDQGKQ